MCGRFTLDIDERFYPRFRLSGNVIEQLKDWQARYNIAPNQTSLVILPGNEATQKNSQEVHNIVTEMRWGLVPFWSKDSKGSYKMINAKAETVLEKPAYRQAVTQRRCIIPASGFYEWQVEGNAKQPFYIQAAEHDYLALAGLYEIWHDSMTNLDLETFTIITTAPNDDMKPLHDRMPLILNDPEVEADWLNTETDKDRIAEILREIPGLKLASYPVAKLVNSPSVDNKTLIETL